MESGVLKLNKERFLPHFRDHGGTNRIFLSDELSFVTVSEVLSGKLRRSSPFEKLQHFLLLFFLEHLCLASHVESLPHG